MQLFSNVMNNFSSKHQSILKVLVRAKLFLLDSALQAGLRINTISKTIGYVVRWVEATPVSPGPNVTGLPFFCYAV